MVPRPAAARLIAAAAGCALAALLGACGASGPADRVLAELEGVGAAGAADPAAIDAYAPSFCAILRDQPSLTVEQVSGFMSSAPSGTYPLLPVQGLTDVELTRLNRAVAAEYCPEALR